MYVIDILLLSLLLPPTQVRAVNYDYDDACPYEGPTLPPTLPLALPELLPGLGVEFESSDLRFEGDCSAKKTYASKGKAFVGFGDDTWMLTGDTTVGEAGVLSAEYIINGETCKLGTNAAARAARNIEHDLVSPALKMKGVQAPKSFEPVRLHGIHIGRCQTIAGKFEQVSATPGRLEGQTLRASRTLSVGIHKLQHLCLWQRFTNCVRGH